MSRFVYQMSCQVRARINRLRGRSKKTLRVVGSRVFGADGNSIGLEAVVGDGIGGCWSQILRQVIQIVLRIMEEQHNQRRAGMRHVDSLVAAKVKKIRVELF